MRRTAKRLLVILGVLLMIIAALSVGQFSSTSVCTRCGAVRRTVEFQIPGTSLTLWTFRRDESSPVSKVLEQEKLISEHVHNWEFCQGSGNGIFCALGRGHRLLHVVETPEMASLVEASHRFGDDDFRDKLVAAIFRAKTKKEELLDLAWRNHDLSDQAAWQAMKDDPQTISALSTTGRDFALKRNNRCLQDAGR